MYRLTLAVFVLAPTVFGGGIHTPSAPYLSFADSPFAGLSGSATYFHLENFEDGALNTPGATNTGGIVLLRSDMFSDSVDGDDGTIDNDGNTGGATTGAMYSAGLSSIEVNFNAALLGGMLPTHVGLVVTDVLTDSAMTFTAYRAGNPLGSVSGFQVSEIVHTTAEDRFYGFTDPVGIDRVVITAVTDVDWALDHVQYGKAAPIGTVVCAGDGSTGSCPCGNNGTSGNGCANSAFGVGANLSATGTPSVASDTAVLTAINMTGSIAVFFQGATTTPPTIIDDGIGCVGGPIIRLGTGPAAGTAYYPRAGNPPISVRGGIPPAGGTYYYQCFYRNSAAAFCPPATSNRTNGVAITWTP
jgi:hypothetical protein